MRPHRASGQGCAALHRAGRPSSGAAGKERLRSPEEAPPTRDQLPFSKDAEVAWLGRIIFPDRVGPVYSGCFLGADRIVVPVGPFCPCLYP